MSEPKRIQRKRTKGWRMPEGSVYVGRPTRWGNPYEIGAMHPQTGEPMTRQDAVDMFDLHTGPFGCWEYDPDTLEDLRADLAGHDLACWCPLDQPCHADVLLRIANERESA